MTFDDPGPRPPSVDGFQHATFEVEHSRYNGPLGNCVATYKLLIVDYELVVDRYLGPGCA